ncbi:response regulator transcription factor [Amycolatopsis sp. H20-H5]|uniref:response regulator transcription factor n=1 Tax=Amycolatopsis sp. H20-H5 TaxID=3046309 RepID=UPI002DBA64A8|nr:response regulator transcription factor [Amycolatopsis sp. H20-H5]MEC3975568.1 response regulator transcription factor [Amycolatopsis sp. H20-H5]
MLLADEFSVPEDRVRRLLSLWSEISVIERVGSLGEILLRARQADSAVLVVNSQAPVITEFVLSLADVAVGGVLAVALTELVDEQITALLTQGVLGIVSATAPTEELITAVRAVSCGSLYLSVPYQRSLARAAGAPEPEAAQRVRRLLTEREIEVLARMANGLANRDIAQQLGISASTTRNHISNVLKKLNLPNRTTAAIFAYRSGLAIG